MRGRNFKGHTHEGSLSIVTRFIGVKGNNMPSGWEGIESRKTLVATALRSLIIFYIFSWFLETGFLSNYPTYLLGFQAVAGPSL